MIAKYKGTCCKCGKPITPGVDTYDYERKESYHRACMEDTFSEDDPPSPEALAIADRLGFK